MQPAELLEVLKTNVRLRRKELGETQAVVAARAGIAQAYLARIESGVKVPSIDVLAQLATALHTTPSALLSPEIFSTATIDR